MLLIERKQKNQQREVRLEAIGSLLRNYVLYVDGKLYHII